jgi:ribosome-binding factor A
MSERIKKVNELLKQEINQLLLREVDFRGAFVTITDIDTSSDLKYTNVKIVIYPEDKTHEVFKILEKDIYDIQQGLNKRLHRSIKYVPKIRFEIDKTETKAQEVEKTLSKIKG